MKTIALIPAYNASKTIEKVIGRIPREIVGEVIVVNDGSIDNTQEVLDRIPAIRVLTHERNRGYGAAQITLYKAALETDADFIVILHADGGHFPEEVPWLLKPLQEGKADVVAGSRTQQLIKNTRPLAGSRILGAMFRGAMPSYTFAANLMLTFLTNVILRTNYHSFHCGFRAVMREALRKIPFEQLTDGYLFDIAFLLTCHDLGLRIVEVPIGTYYDKDAGSSVNSIKYGLEILLYVLKRWLNRSNSS